MQYIADMRRGQQAEADKVLCARALCQRNHLRILRERTRSEHEAQGVMWLLCVKDKRARVRESVVVVSSAPQGAAFRWDDDANSACVRAHALADAWL